MSKNQQNQNDEVVELITELLHEQIPELKAEEKPLAIEIKSQDETSTLIAIQDEMTIYTALEQKENLLSYLKNDHELQIDLSAVGEIDSAGMQLLILLKKEAEMNNCKLSLIQHSKAVVEVIEHFNLIAFFGDSLVLLADWKD